MPTQGKTKTIYSCDTPGCTRAYDSEAELDLHKAGKPGFQPHPTGK